MTALWRGNLDASPPSLPDPGLTLARHRIAALCIMLLQADFGVEIAGTMWIVLSVFSKIRITMAFAQLTHTHLSLVPSFSASLITSTILLIVSDSILTLKKTKSGTFFCTIMKHLGVKTSNFLCKLMLEYIFMGTLSPVKIVNINDESAHITLKGSTTAYVKQD